MNNADLQAYIGALGRMFDQSEQAIRPAPGLPPWAGMFDPMAVPIEAIPWLSQWIGVEPEVKSLFETNEDFYARQRQRIVDHVLFDRGSPAAMKAAALPYLTGTKTVIFRERDGSPYHLTVVTRTAETPDPDAVLRALIAQKPAGITLDYHTIAGHDYQEATDSGRSYAASQALYTTYFDRGGS